MTKIPEFLRSHLALRQSRAGEHPSAGLLAEFVEQTLPARERADLLEHLARCPECREILGAASIPGVNRAPQVVWWKWRWAAATAAACLVAGLFWLPGSFQNASRNTTPLAPAAPSAPKEEEPKAAEAKRSTVAKKRAAKKQIDSQPEAKLPAPPQLAIEQPEKNAAIEVERPNMMFQSRLRASGAHALATLRPERGNSRWNLDGELRKSDDGGKTWRTVPVDDQARLYALSAAGSNVWVGGANGVLFHSADDGLEWRPVFIADGNERLTETITRIEARDENWVKLTTRSGNWLTTDGGAHWRRE